LYLDGKLHVDYLVRFERLQEDFDIACDLMSTPRRPLPHFNPSARLANHNLYFDAEPAARELALSHFKRDFDLFEYPTT
jgi:hypothetical protein